MTKVIKLKINESIDLKLALNILESVGSEDKLVLEFQHERLPIHRSYAGESSENTVLRCSNLYKPQGNANQAKDFLKALGGSKVIDLELINFGAEHIPLYGSSYSKKFDFSFFGKIFKISILNEQPYSFISGMLESMPSLLKLDVPNGLSNIQSFAKAIGSSNVQFLNCHDDSDDAPETSAAGSGWEEGKICDFPGGSYYSNEESKPAEHLGQASYSATTDYSYYP